MREIKGGVLQGSIFVPLPYHGYVNNIDKSSNFDILSNLDSTATQIRYLNGPVF